MTTFQEIKGYLNYPGKETWKKNQWLNCWSMWSVERHLDCLILRKIWVRYRNNVSAIRKIGIAFIVTELWKRTRKMVKKWIGRNALSVKLRCTMIVFPVVTYMRQDLPVNVNNTSNVSSVWMLSRYEISWRYTQEVYLFLNASTYSRIGFCFCFCTKWMNVFFT